MEAEDRVAGGIGFKQVGEARLDTCGLVAERQRSARGWETLRNAFAVFLRLDLHTDERVAFRLRLNHSRSLAFDKEQVVRFTEAVAERELAYSDAGAGIDIRVDAVLDDPTSGRQQAVNRLPGLFFRCQVGLKALGPRCMTRPWEVSRCPRVQRQDFPATRSIEMTRFTQNSNNATGNATRHPFRMFALQIREAARHRRGPDCDGL
ncbi:MAG: hypothetical protein ACLQKY_07370 [Terracidiphilus sp.]